MDKMHRLRDIKDTLWRHLSNTTVPDDIQQLQNEGRSLSFELAGCSEDDLGTCGNCGIELKSGSTESDALALNSLGFPLLVGPLEETPRLWCRGCQMANELYAAEWD